MIENTEKNVTEVSELIGHLSTKRGWPKLLAGHTELTRIAMKYARDLAHLEEVITDVSENWELCPDARELKLKLQGRVPGDLPVYEPDWLKEAREKRTREKVEGFAELVEGTKFQ